MILCRNLAKMTVGKTSYLGRQSAKMDLAKEDSAKKGFGKSSLYPCRDNIYD